MGPWWPLSGAFGSVTLRYVDIRAGHSRHCKHPFTARAVTNPCKSGLSQGRGAKRLPPVTHKFTGGSLQGNYDGGVSVHAAQVQDQLGIAVALQHDGNAPVLLVEVACGVVRDLAVLRFGAVAGGGPGGDVQDAVRHVG